MTAAVESVKIVADLLDWYLRGDAIPECVVLDGERMDSECFLREVFRQRNYGEAVEESVAELFFKVLKYESLLDRVWKAYQRSRTRRFPRKVNNNGLYLVFFYYAIFELNESTLSDIQNLMVSVDVDKGLALANFMKKSEFLPLVFEAAAQMWDIEYVRNLLPKTGRETYEELYRGIRGKIMEDIKSQQKEVTKPVEMQVLKRSEKDRPKVDALTDSSEGQVASEARVRIKPTRIPRTTYAKPNYPRLLEEDRARNQEKARELYDEAQRSAFRVASLPKGKKEADVVEECAPKREPVRRSRIPVKKEPSIQPKKTAAVILREGARLVKLEQEEIRRLDDIMKGAFNSEALKALEKEIQEERTRKHLEEIEKKHLQGLLTYEEALLAKQKYFKKTKEGADEFRKEKEMWMKQLESWRAEEQMRIRESVEKGKAYEKGAKEAVEHVKEEKHRLALETMEESKTLKEKWLAEKEEELKRKIQIIKEIKALQAFGLIRRKETAANATASIGLLCEMSTEELKERLMILRMEVKEEIERRREEIRQKKECRKAVVDGYRDLIEQYQEIRKEKQRVMEMEKKPKSPVRSSSVEALKKKLCEKRKERLKHTITKA